MGMIEGMKLMIAIPSYDYMDAEFVRSLCGLVKRLAADGVDFDVRIRNGSLVYCARNDLAFEAWRDGFTHVLWLDSDVIFDDDVVYKLAALKKHFVTGVCRSRRPHYGYCVYKNMEPCEKYERLPDIPFLIDGCGFAIVLTTTELLKKVGDAHDDVPFTPSRDFGEDLQFCYNARKQGCSLWCEPAVQISHVGRVIVRPTDISDLNDYFELYKEKGT